METDFRNLPLVAIVTPVYNGGAYLRSAMQCVQAQTYPNLIHIVLDNASTDDTPKIIDSFRDAKVKVVSSRNSDLLPAFKNWNKAFSYLPTNTTYAKLLCADDLIHPSYVIRCVELAETDPEIQIVLCHDVYRDTVYHANLPCGDVIPGVEVARRILDRSICWLPYQHFFVRVQDEDRGTNFCGNVRIPDPYVVVRSALRGKFGYLRKPLVYTRWHAGSETSRLLRNKDAELWMAELRLIKIFGRCCWDDSHFARILDLAVGRMARFILRWAFSGQFHAAKLMSKQLTDEGFPLTSTDYVRYTFGWPAYALRKRFVPKPTSLHLDERAFNLQALEKIPSSSV